MIGSGAAARTRATPVVAAALAVGFALLSGCAAVEKPSAASKVRPETCFGVFTPSELAPLLGRGDEVTVDSPYDLELNAQRRGVTCNIYVDGKTRFFATADRLPQGQYFVWAPAVDEQKPDALPFAQNSKLWDGGAAVVLECSGPTDAFELRLWIDGSAEKIRQDARRPLFTELMQKYLDFAKEQTGCAG
ncbi:hypothetical protein [Streptomyces sp. NPDC048357]|uniref:hypothetical protein n=1 Tax=Streptomyces sp. NPDC048357 TaxID=3154719 RepID=UPI003436265B